MSTYNPGGYVGGTVRMRIAVDECIIGRDGKCRREDPPHRSATIPPRDERIWTCPTHDTHPAPTSTGAGTECVAPEGAARGEGERG